MNKYLKWTLWIVGLLLVVAAFFAIGYFAFSHWNGGFSMMYGRGDNAWQGGERIPWRNMPMHPGVIRPDGRFMGFSLFGFFVGALFRLGIFVLVIVGIVALVRGFNSRPVAAAPSVVTAAPVEQPAPAPVVTGKTCSNCGRAVQADWSHCPYCGNALT